MKRDFTFTSYDKKTKIHGIEWKANGKPIAVVQIVHGMVEHIGRYEEFATFLNKQGICVIGHDHLGHGASVRSQEHLGYIAKSNGNQCLIQDIHRLRQMIDQKYPDIPHILMGHSMGSFLTRQYLMYYAKGLSAAIIMGTGYHPAFEAIAGIALCKSLAAVRGPFYRSKLVDFIGIGNYNKPFEPSDSKKAWVTSQEEERRAYESDPLCSYTFTLNGYQTLMETLREITHTEYLAGLPKDLSILVISGSQDPVGSFEKGVRKVYHEYREAGLRNLRLKFFADARHEILHEYCKDEAFEFIADWIQFTLKHLSSFD